MADWSKPTVTDIYSNVLSFIDGRLNDAATQFSSAPSNQPTGAIRYLRASNKFQEWDGAAWQDKVLSVAGGGTGSATAAGARSNLGLGDMAVQSSSGVAITGGSITGLSTFSLATDLTFTTDGNRNIGSNATRPNNVYIRNGLVIPVGTNKWVSS